VTIRVLDLGGDKQVPYLGSRREANPFMGFRSIRLMTDYPELFRTQLRAILRASRYGHISVMFPMISRVEEVIELKLLFEELRKSLIEQGLQLPDRIPFGVMAEVPSAALCINEILDLVDFVSIGSNDLTQYLMAADRDNPKVAHLVDPCYPAVLRLLRGLIGACVERQKPVTLCGEMAGSPRCLLPLLGMGLRRFSMAPAFVGSMKEMAKTITLADARQAAEKVLSMRTLAEVRDYLNRRVRELCPRVAELEVG
jgi:phosphoenolpyruvate-protein kinase (PTS system EI component)